MEGLTIPYLQCPASIDHGSVQGVQIKGPATPRRHVQWAPLGHTDNAPLHRFETAAMLARLL